MTDANRAPRNDCPTGHRSDIGPRMSIETPPSRETTSARRERQDGRDELVPLGQREHWDHSRESGAPIDDAQAWAAVLRRDRAYDGRFVTGVLTTGIF